MADAVDWQLVKEAAAGDARARQSLVESTVDNLWALAMRLVRRRDEAEDIVQETFVRMFATISNLTPQGRFEGYLARIATNLVVERWRRKRPAGEISEALPSPDDAEPWQMAADKEDRRRLLEAAWQAIERLDPEPRAAVLLFYAQNQSCDAISEILDVPVGTVKTWLFRSRNQIRQEASRLLGGDPAHSRPKT
jgi:RNA polymerase sigma-70 factor (ECF subfamily)